MIQIGTKGWDLPSITSLNQKQVRRPSKQYSTFIQHRIYSTLQWAQLVPSFMTSPKPPLPALSSVCCWGQGHLQASQGNPLNEIILKLSSFTRWRRKQTKFFVPPCPASPVQALHFLAPFANLLLSFWPSKRQVTLQWESAALRVLVLSTTGTAITKILSRHRAPECNC